MPPGVSSREGSEAGSCAIGETRGNVKRAATAKGKLKP